MIDLDIKYSLDAFYEIENLKVKGDLLVVDKNIYTHHANRIQALFKGGEILILPIDESEKNLTRLLEIIDFFIENKLERDNKVFIIGGGVLGDMAGFATSIYKRGIDYIQIPTSLLSQIDSSIGGKTGVDYGGYKNIIGSFHLPRKTIIDFNFLKSLPKREIISGFGEIVKYGIISDYEILEDINFNMEEIRRNNLNIIGRFINKSIEVKEEIVSLDINEKGLRKKLNAGHTIGHGIESYYNYEKYKHGEAILLGLYYEATIAYNRSYITRDYYEVIYKIIRSFIEIEKFTRRDIDKIYTYMKMDKKNIGGRVSFILPINIESVEEFFDISLDEIYRAMG